MAEVIEVRVPWTGTGERTAPALADLAAGLRDVAAARLAALAGALRDAVAGAAR